MSGWELVKVTNSICDECARPATCTVYRKAIGCNCSKCKDRVKSYFHYIHICGYCIGKWLKTNGQFKVLDE